MNKGMKAHNKRNGFVVLETLEQFDILKKICKNAK